MKTGEWRETVGAAIYGTMIAAQVMDFMREGRGAPGPEEMRRFSVEADAVAYLWREVTPIPITYGVRET